MSESSFDTSVANTAASLTSVLSLGQCIKQTAEESQATEWFVLQPTIEKDWHTLQAEQSSQATLFEEISEYPLQESPVTSTSLELPEISNPVAQLLERTRAERAKAGGTENKRASHDALLKDPDYARNHFESKSSTSGRGHSAVVPAYYPDMNFKPKHRSEAERESLAPVSRLSASLLRNEDRLAANNLSSLLEKDDSLAERVRSLLEDDEEADQLGPLAQAGDQTRLKSQASASSTQQPPPMSASENVEHGRLQELPELLRKTPATQAINTADPAHFQTGTSDGFDQHSPPRNVPEARDSLTSGDVKFEEMIRYLPRPSDPFGSLNTSRSTEYGDLPETVDIPADIVKRLSNMRMIDQGHQRREAWAENVSHVPGSGAEKSEPSLEARKQINRLDGAVGDEISPTHRPSHPSTSAQLSGGIPISGDVKYHLGSNPVTPQFEMEQESLRQLQTYIESKTGLPAVSPLVEGVEVGDVEPKPRSSLVKSDYLTSATPAHSENVTWKGDRAPQAKLQREGSDASGAPRASHESVSPPSNHVTDFSGGQDMGNYKRREPEGMSPPILTTTGPSRSQNAASSVMADRRSSPGPRSDDSVHAMNGTGIAVTFADQKTERLHDAESTPAEDPKVDSMLDQSLADESILARIKTALSESFSKQKFGSSVCNPSAEMGDLSNLSYASSIDSLAFQVKALLEDEAKNAAESTEDDQLQVSNLSEAIESFENTDLWKFVRQFLPSSEAAPLVPEVVGAGDELNVSVAESESSLANSLLMRIRAEFQKEKEQSTKIAAQSERDAGQQEAVVPQDRGLGQQPTSAVQSVPAAESSRYARHPPVPSVISKPSSLPRPKVTIADDVQEKSSSHAHRMEDRVHDPVPGIPDFSRSVFSPAHSDAVTHDTLTTSAQTLERPHVVDAFSNYKATAKSVIETQMDRAVARTFDKSLSPTKHQRLFPDKTNREEKVDDIRVSSYRSEDSANEPSINFHRTDTSETSRTSSTKPDVPDAFKEKPQPDATRHETRAVADDAKRTAEKKSSSYFDPKSVVTPSEIPKAQSAKRVTPSPSQGIPTSSYFQRKNRSSPRSSSHSGKSLHWGSPAREEPARRTSYPPPKSPYSIPNRRGSPPRKTPLCDRVTLHQWLRSPERGHLQDKQRPLPSFEELMRQEEVKEKTDRAPANIAPTQNDLDLIPTSDKENKLREVDLNVNTTASKPSPPTYTKPAPPTFAKSDSILQSPLRKSTLDEIEPDRSVPDQSSMLAQVPSPDSYQNAYLSSPGQPPSARFESSAQGTSDLDMHRRTVSPSASALDERDSLLAAKPGSTLATSLAEFQSLDDTAQREMIRTMLKLFHRKRQSASSTRSGAARSRPSKEQLGKSSKVRSDLSTLLETSCASNEAVCDSDSTEYYDLPPSRQTSTLAPADTSSRQILGVNESKAEQIMKRLLNKIEQQRAEERRLKHQHRRTVASSSTPEKYRPPLIIPEASSIATTDTDAGQTMHVIQLREKRHAGHKKKKIAYIEEVSSSEPTVIKVKKRPKKSENKPTRVVLHDRSVQANEEDMLTARDVATNCPSPVLPARRSYAVQTQVTRSPDIQDGDPHSSLNDTITLEDHVADIENKENRDARDPSNGRTDRISSFFVDFKAKKKTKTPLNGEPPAPVRRSLAWYEPYRYQPPWMDLERTKPVDTTGLERVTLQEALRCHHPDFVSKSRERQRRITINAEERRLQEVWAEERHRVFGTVDETRRKAPRNAPPFRRRAEMSRKQIVSETREKYQQLPEVVQKKKEEQRKREYASHRLKAQLYKKRIQNRVLKKLFFE